jgi:hypothetical protein
MAAGSLALGFTVTGSLCRAGDKTAGGDQQPARPEPGTVEAVIANNPISAILQGPKLWTETQDPEDWVKATRPKEPSDYMPVGVTPPQHPLRVKTPAELAATKAALEAARAAMEKRLGRRPVPASAGSSPRPKPPYPDKGNPPAAAEGGERN